MDLPNTVLVKLEDPKCDMVEMEKLGKTRMLEKCGKCGALHPFLYIHPDPTASGRGPLDPGRGPLDPRPHCQRQRPAGPRQRPTGPTASLPAAEARWTHGLTVSGRGPLDPGRGPLDPRPHCQRQRPALFRVDTCIRMCSMVSSTWRIAARAACDYGSNERIDYGAIFSSRPSRVSGQWREAWRAWRAWRIPVRTGWRAVFSGLG